MTDDDLRALGKQFLSWERVPPALRGVILNIEWEREALFRLDLPVDSVPVAELRWQLALPWWTDGDTKFVITPHEVRANPQRYPGHWQRTLDADLSFPIHVVATTPTLRILDGVHRLLKADTLGHDGIRIYRVDGDHLRQIIVPARP